MLAVVVRSDGSSATRLASDVDGDLSWPIDVLRPSRDQYLSSAFAVLEAAIPADTTTWHAFDAVSGKAEVFSSTAGQAWGDAAAKLLHRVVDDHPMISSYRHPATRHGAVPRRMTDIITCSQLHRTRAYAELLRPFGAEYQLTILTGRHATGAWRCWTLNRADRDFTAGERDLAVRMQPALVALDLVCSMTPPAPGADAAAERTGLTAREIEVLRLVDQGLTAVAIGRVLRITSNTVRKHLQHSYAKLGTHDRLMAMKRARQLGLLGGQPLVS